MRIEWTSREIPSHKVQGLGCTFGYVIQMVIQRQSKIDKPEVYHPIFHYNLRPIYTVLHKNNPVLNCP